MKRYIVVMITIWALWALTLPPVSAITSYSTTGNEDEKWHSTHQLRVRQANNELNDYYHSNKGEFHTRHQEGQTVGQELMRFQSRIPQNVFINAHGNGGTQATMGTTSEETLKAIYYGDDIKGKTGWTNSRAPFSCFFIAACDSSKNVMNSFRSEIILDLDAWVFIGYPKANSEVNAACFVKPFYHELCDEKSSYKRSVEEALKEIPSLYQRINTYKITLVDRYNSGLMDHRPKYDKYRGIDRTIGQYGEILEEGESLSFKLTRNFKGNSNGGYILFHGNISSDWTDLTTDLTLQIKVYKKVGGSFQVMSAYTTTWTDMKNQCNDQSTVRTYGGSDIASIYIPPSVLKNTIGSGEIKFEAFCLDDNDSDDEEIQINRFEFMEIGSGKV